jgi:hypothetical protein
MTHLDKQEFHAWAYGDLLANTTCGVLNREVLMQNMIRLGPPIALGPHQCAYDELKTAIHAAAAVNRGA